jgi:ATP-dependent Zn protease
MGPVTRSTFAVRIVVCAACVACLVCAYAIPAAGATSTTSGGHVTTENEQALKRQIAADEITSASFRIKEHSLRLVLKNGQHVAVHLSGPPSAKLRAELDKSGAKVSKKSPPHKRRYIVAGIAVVVLILVAGALVVWRRRRHAALDEYES